jgi:succinylglutamate desuccinylase
VAGQHGNEPSGIVAMERVFAALDERALVPRGRVLGLSGNVGALAQGRRYLARDLNRMWTRAEVALAADGADDVPEEAERHELLGLLHAEFDRTDGTLLVLDLHTASSRTTPFVVLGDTLRNRRFARSFGAPIILGLEEELRDTLMEYVTGHGHVSLAFEGGQHDDPRSVDHHEAAIWIALVSLGSLAAGQVPDLERYRRQLRDARGSLPPVLEILGAHPIGPDDRFVMQPGYYNFQRVARGEHLATDRSGPILAPRDAILFLPLYQGLGTEGFFLARAVNPVWLRVSAALRRLGAPAVAPLLPGVHRHPELLDTLVVDRNVARFFAPQLFHLLGYRVRTADGDLEVRRRRE